MIPERRKLQQHSGRKVIVASVVMLIQDADFTAVKPDEEDLLWSEKW